MIDQWKQRAFEKFIKLGLPGLLAFIAVCIWGPPLAIPFFIPMLAFCMAPALSEVFSQFFPNVFWGSSKTTENRPTFSIARSLKHQGKHAEALEALKDLADESPQEIDIWLEMLELAIMDIKDKAVAETIYREGLTCLETRANRELLTRFYNNITGK